MRPDRGTLLIAAVAVVAAAVLAGVSGPVPGVFEAVAAGLVSAALWQLRVNWLARTARAAELETAEKAYAPPGPVRDGGVAQLLQAEEEVVSFWPRPEMEELVEWIVSPQHVAIQLVVGEGGTGKTRLARRLADEVTELGFRSWWVPASTRENLPGTARNAGQPALLIVDYAETRIGLQELLAEAAEDTDGPVMRLLLLARSPGEWWQQLISSSGYQLRELLAAVQPITLGPLSDESSQPEVFRQALAAFARKLEVACPDAENPLSGLSCSVLVIL